MQPQIIELVENINDREQSFKLLKDEAFDQMVEVYMHDYDINIA